jgi:hypothetical protein
VRRQLIELLLKAGRERDAVLQCQQLPDDLPWRGLMPMVVRGAALVVANDPGAALGPLRKAYRGGCRDTVCLRWLAAAYLAVGQLADLESLAAEWERLEPGNLEIAAFRQAARQQANGRRPRRTRRVDIAAPPSVPSEPAPSTLPIPTPQS